MRNILFIITSRIVVFGLLLPLPGCKKMKERTCAEWEVRDTKVYKGSGIDWGCAGSRTYQLVFCGDELKNVSPGYSKVISTGDCEITRTFNRFIRSW